MGDSNEKQTLIVTVSVSAVLTLIFLVLIYMDRQTVYAGEDPGPSDPEGQLEAQAIPEDEWGERRKIQDLQAKTKLAQAEADKMSERENNVIVFRQIVERDAAYLPDEEDVNLFAETVRDFENASGVLMTNVSDLTLKPSGQAISTLPISLQLEGSFDQFLKFLNMFESYDRLVNTRSFTVTTGEVTVDANDLKTARHGISLSLLTYVYVAGAGNLKPVAIPNYDKRKLDPDIVREVRKFKEPNVGKYPLKSRARRRDPLIENRVMPVAQTPDGEMAGRVEQEALVDQLWQAFMELQTDYDAYVKLDEEGKVLQAATMLQTVTEKISAVESKLQESTTSITIPEVKDYLQKRVITPFDAIKEKIDLGPRKVEISVVKVREFHGKMKNLFGRAQYRQVIATWQAFQAYVKGRPVAARAKPVLEDMRTLATQSQNRLDFKGLGLVCSGIIRAPAIPGRAATATTDEVPATPDRSRAILRGMPWKVGDYVDEKKECELRKIEKDRLLFRFRGEEIELVRESGHGAR